MGDCMTFIFDVKNFNIYKSALLAYVNEINFLGVKDSDGTVTFINLKNAERIIVTADQIRIEFDDYYYVITPDEFRYERYVKL